MKTISEMSSRLKGMSDSEMNQVNGGAKYIRVTVKSKNGVKVLLIQVD
jgi:bacteriocin-like protein